jgi:hypothetical protein
MRSYQQGVACHSHCNLCNGVTSLLEAAFNRAATVGEVHSRLLNFSITALLKFLAIAVIVNVLLKQIHK